MISQLAKETVEQFKAEGLSPSFEDCIRLNALGLRIEKSAHSFDMASAPRAAFLGDLILWEPTVAVRIWLDAAQGIVADDFFSRLFLVAYALNTPAAELVPLTSVKKLTKAVARFAEDNLMQFTETQILAAVEYAMRGDDSDDGEDPEPTEAEREARRKCREMPEPLTSAARRLMDEANAVGIGEVAERVTVAALDRMVATAIMIRGTQAVSGENGRATADFYRTADAIHSRLTKEKNNGGE